MLIYGLIIFTLLIVGGINVIMEFRSNDASFMNNDKFTMFNKSFNRFDTLNSSISSMQSSIQGAQPDWGVFGVLNSLIKSSWSAISNLFSSLRFVNDILQGLSVVFGVPTWAVGLVSMMFIVLICFTIWALIFQGRT